MIYSNKPIQFKKERRSRPDPIMQIIHLSNGLVWLILIAFLLTTNAAMPPVETFYDRLFWRGTAGALGFSPAPHRTVDSGGSLCCQAARASTSTPNGSSARTITCGVSLVITGAFSLIGSIVMLFVMG